MQARRALSCCHPVLPEARQGPALSNNGAHDPTAALPTQHPLQKQLQAEPTNFYAFASKYCPMQETITGIPFCAGTTHAGAV